MVFILNSIRDVIVKDRVLCIHFLELNMFPLEREWRDNSSFEKNSEELFFFKIHFIQI